MTMTILMMYSASVLILPLLYYVNLHAQYYFLLSPLLFVCPHLLWHRPSPIH